MEVGWQEEDGDRLWNDLFIGMVNLAPEQLLASMPKKIMALTGQRRAPMSNSSK